MPSSLEDNHSGSHTQLVVPQDLTGRITKIDDQPCAGGSFGDVYRCRYRTELAVQEVAVKTFRFEFTVADGDTGSGRAARMIRRELGIWKRLSHPSIVPFLGIVYGFGRLGNTSLVSSWMPNGTLQDFLAKNDNELTVTRRLQLLLGIANGLEYLHSLSIVHGDLTGNNVLLDDKYNARLTDFGYASLAGELPEALAYLQASTLRPGTVRWAAPELFMNGEGAFQCTTNSDIYSFGNVALQVLSGKLPWSEFRRCEVIVIELVNGRKPRRPQSHLIDDQHWKFIEDCWSPVRERPPAEHLVRSILEFLRSFPDPPPLHSILVSSDNNNPQSGLRKLSKRRSSGISPVQTLQNDMKQHENSGQPDLSYDPGDPETFILLSDSPDDIAPPANYDPSKCNPPYSSGLLHRALSIPTNRGVLSHPSVRPDVANTFEGLRFGSPHWRQNQPLSDRTLSPPLKPQSLPRLLIPDSRFESPYAPVDSDIMSAYLAADDLTVVNTRQVESADNGRTGHARSSRSGSTLLHPSSSQQDSVNRLFLYPQGAVPFIRDYPRRASRSRGGGERSGSALFSNRPSPYPSPSASPRIRHEDLPNVAPTSRELSVPDAPLHTNGSITSVTQTVTSERTAGASHRRKKQDANFVCPVPGCGKTFIRSFDLKNHMRSHNEDCPFLCKWPGCGKRFARQHDCKDHEQLHSNYRFFTCEKCNKIFSGMNSLDQHREHVHSEGGAEYGRIADALKTVSSSRDPLGRSGNT